jgi:CheY-like chemotaxis protein/HPt (histidine-containing phosphotransfer) domain-containing protein
MPVIDGYTATREIRKWELESRSSEPNSINLSVPRISHPASRIPIIAMTAHAMSGDQEKSIAAGMNDHITKPIDPARLFETLAKWIGRRKATRSSGKAAPVPSGPPADRPAPPEQVLPDVLPGFDLVEGLQRLMGNRALYRKLLVDFATRYRQAPESLRGALDAGDFKQAHELVHAVKGVAGNLAAKDLQRQSVALEKLVKHADPAGAPPEAEINRAYEGFRQSLGRVLDSLTSVLARDAAPAPPVEAPVGSLSPALAKEAAARLREAAELGDLSGLASVCRELSAKSEAFAPCAARVARLADDFDFEGVVKLAEELEK